MNLPNAITVGRFVLIPLYFVAFFADGKYNMFYALGILILAGVTDVLDGYLARRRHQVTAIGIMLDPLADKLMMVAVVVSLVLDNRVPWIIAGLLLFREVAMISSAAFFHLRGFKTFPAAIWGKVTTVLYYISLGAVMFRWPFARDLLWLTVGLSFLTSFIYLAKFRSLNA